MNEIDDELPVSKGSINNIIHDWKTIVNGTDVEEIRRFLSEFRKSGMGIKECIRGFRIANILKKFQVYDEFTDWMEDDDESARIIKKRNKNSKSNVQEEEEYTYLKDKESGDLLKEIRLNVFASEGNTASNYNGTPLEKKTSNSKGFKITYFINDIYKICKSHGIKPSMIIKWMEDLFHFYSVLPKLSLEDTGYYHSYQTQENDPYEKRPSEEEQIDMEMMNEIPLISKVSYLINQRKKEIALLISNQNSIIEEIDSLNKQKQNVQSQLSNIIKEYKKAFSYFEWYTNLKQELLCKFNLAIELEFESFAKAINDFKEYGYSAPLLIKDLKEFESLKKQLSLTRQEIQSNQKTLHNLQNEISQLEVQYYNYTLTMNNYHELEQIGFGLKELKQLKGLYTEISVANKIDPSEAGTRFFKEIEKNYDSRLGLELKIKENQVQFEQLQNKVAEYQRYLALQSPVAPNLAFLHAQGLTNDDINGITNLVLSLNNSYLLDLKPIKKDNTIYAYTTNDIKDKKEFWKLIVEKLKDINSINSEIVRLSDSLNEIEAMREAENNHRNTINYD